MANFESQISSDFETLHSSVTFGIHLPYWRAEVEFRTHFHPYVEKLRKTLAGGSVSALQEADTDLGNFPSLGIIGSGPAPDGGYEGSGLVKPPFPRKSIEFESDGAYSVYNWELFFHVPLAVAIHLSRNQRFEEARNWFHYVFDPTDTSEGETPRRFWKVKPFKKLDMESIQEIIDNLTAQDADEELRRATNDSIHAWMQTPFRPHVIARFRPSAYMYKTVMAYLDNLIAWGDDLFRQDTGETINEAAMLYVLAANILGDRPQQVPRYNPVPTKAKTYKDLKGVTQTVQRAAEQHVRLYGSPLVHAGNRVTPALGTLLSFSPYFCVPDNAEALKYWDTVADRLYKIRNSLNIQGVFRQLPLFEPPIDPALLIRARAAGLDISRIVSGLNQPLPLVRFRLLVQKAAEICQEVKSLGGSLLSVLEKKDGEAMSILRARHERAVLEMAESVKYGQWQDALKAREGLEESFGNTVRRYVYYEMLLGRKENEIEVPELKELESSELERMKLQLNEPGLQLRHFDIQLAKNVEDQRKISTYEASDLKDLKDAQDLHEKAVDQRAIVAKINKQPQVTETTGFSFPGGSGSLGTGISVSYGSQQIAAIYAANAEKFEARAAKKIYESGKTSKMGGYERREQEWAFQSNTAAGEITQTYKQLRGAQIREAVAEREWKNHKQQIKHAEAIEQFLTSERKGKVTNQGFYVWMKREVTGLHARCFDLAYDVAKKAERALQHELGDSGATFIQSGYTAGREGLMAGEKLHLDIKRMEMAYHELNEREYELTKHVSLLQVDPMALVTLRATGKCIFSISEELFDFDGPGHYFRRIRSVSLSVPCVTGPYAGVNCRLTLQRSRIRTSTSLADGYAENTQDNAGDSRFQTYRGSIQSVVASSGQGDSGLFETNLNDVRYLPFENSGVISTWEMKLPGDPSLNEPCQFDYGTISDAVLHIRYTAREGGDRLRTGAISNLKDLITGESGAGAGRVPMTRLLSVRHEFPTEWAAFISASNPATLSLTLREEHYPYWSKNWLAAGSISRARIIMRVQGGFSEVDATEAVASPLFGTSPINFGSHNNNSIDDLWIALTWEGSE